MLLQRALLRDWIILNTRSGKRTFFEHKANVYALNMWKLGEHQLKDSKQELENPLDYIK